VTLSATKRKSTEEKDSLRTIGKTSLIGTVATGTGTEPYPVSKLATWIGTDIEVTYRATSSSKRTVVGKLVGIAQRDRSGNPPDAVLSNKSSKLILVNTTRIERVRSMMEFDSVWEMNAMELARIGYEAWKDSSKANREWVELSPVEKEFWLASADAVRNAVNLAA
jgi:hypothetical protein